MFSQEFCIIFSEESSMNNNFFFEDNVFSGNIFNGFNLEQSSVPSSLPQTLNDHEQQNINEEENKSNKSNKSIINLSILNDRQQFQQFEEEANSKPVNSVKINDTNGNLFDEPEKEEKKKINEKQKEINFHVYNLNLKKTNFTSKENEQLNPVIVKPGTTNISLRIDYAKKYFKTNFVKFIKKYANKLIHNSALPKKLKKNINSPNSLSFTSNTNDSDNIAFLSFTIQKIFCYYKEGNKYKNSLQKVNKERIEEIMNFIQDKPEFENIYSFFKMSLEYAYELFYESEEFKKYADDTRIIYQDKEFKIQKGFSLLEKNGFIKMIKSV